MALRDRVLRALQSQQTHTAVFLADKLYSLSASQDHDAALLLIDALLAHGESRQALDFITTHYPSIQQDARFLLRAARCHSALKQWSELITLLDFDYDSMDAELCASLHLIHGKAHQHVDRRRHAATHFKQALSKDAACVEAFELLTTGHLLTAQQERDLLASLHFPVELSWLRSMYACMIDKYAPIPPDVESHLVSVGLGNNSDLHLSRAEHLFAQGDYAGAHEITTQALGHCHLHQAILTVHLACKFCLGHTNDLFLAAHQLVDSYPDEAVSWFGVGCYYLLLGRPDEARRFFSKTTTINPSFAPAWLGFGHTFAAEAEHDQALAAYRTAARLFIGSHLGPLCIGMELVGTHNLPAAESCLVQAREMCPADPIPWNELGVVACRSNRWQEGADFFQHALEQFQRPSTKGRSVVLFNLAHALRVLGDYRTASSLLEESLSLEPNDVEAIAALGFVRHLSADFDGAISMYHRALSLDRDHAFAGDMLTRALKTVAS